MKISGFTFLRNGQVLGYPFVESIRSILPLVDEFVIAPWDPARMKRRTWSSRSGIRKFA